MAVTEGSVGTRLREARAARGVGLDEAFQHTRINKRFLQALERDAPPREFPAPIYARAFLEEYARYLGLDPDPLVEAYRREHEAEGVEPEPIRLLRPVEETRAPWLKVILLVGSVAALVAIAVLAVRATGEPEATTPPEVTAPSPATSPPAPADEPPSESEPPEIRGIRLTLVVEGAPCWISVTRRGEILYQDTAQPGFRMKFRAGPQGQLDLILGAPETVKLRLNGQKEELPVTSGEPFQGSVIFEDGRAQLVPAA